MQILKEYIGFPVLIFKNVQFSVAEPMVLNVFELAVIQVIRRFAHGSEYVSWTMERIFNEFFGVPKADSILNAVLDEMIAKRIILCKNCTKELAAIPIGDWEFGENGSQLLNKSENVLHGVIIQRYANYSYDPIQEKLINRTTGKSTTWRTGKPNIAVDETPFLHVFPGHSIQEDLKKHPPKWLTPQTEIVYIMEDTPSVVWQQLPVSFFIEKGKLFIKNETPRIQEYLNNVTAKDLQESILGVLYKKMPDWMSYPLMDSEDFEALPADQCYTANSEFGESNIACINSSIGVRVHARICLAFDHLLDRPIKVWYGEESDRGRITFKEHYPFNGIIFATEKYCFSGVRVPVLFSGETIELPMIVRKEYGSDSYFVSEFLSSAQDLAAIHIGDGIRGWWEYSEKLKELIERLKQRHHK